MENSHHKRISKSYENYSHHSNSDQIYDNEKSGNTIRIKFHNKNNKNSFLKIDMNFSLSCSNISNNLKGSMLEKENDISSISLSDDESFISSNVDSLKNDTLFKTYFKKPKKEDVFKRFDYLYDCFYKIESNKFKNTKIRCFINEENEFQDNQAINQCGCIPILKKGKYCLFFKCGQKRSIIISIESLLKHIFNGNLFIPNNNKIKKAKLQEMDDDIKAFRYSIIKIKSHLSREIDSKFKNYKKYCSIYENASNESIKSNALNIIISYFLFVCKSFNAYIYYHIIKRQFFENLDLSEENNSDLKKIIKENLLVAKENIKIRKRKKKKEKRKIIYSRILWIIEFYFKEQIKNDIDKCIYIGITLEGYIIIYMFSFLIEKNNEKELYKIIKKEKMNIYQPQKIKKLKNIFISNDFKEHNYFLLCSPNYNKAIIIDITNNFKNIELIQEININKGLHNCVEFKYSNCNYLLDANIDFTLWYYSEKINGLEYKTIEPKIKESKRFRPIKYLEKRKLFIVQNVKYPNESIEFYTIDEKNKELYLILIKKITIKEEKFINHNFLSDSYNNSCVIKEKYLLIGAKANFYRDGGIYIINLDNFKLIKYRGFFRCKGINCLLNIGNNMAICSSKKETKKGVINNNINNINKKKKKNRNKKYTIKMKDNINNAFRNKNYKSNNLNIINQEQNINNNNNINIQKNVYDIKKIMPKNQLVLFELNEKKNGEVVLDIKKNLNGNYFWINCDKLIMDSYIICSLKNNNSLIKVDNEDLIYFLIINCPFE